MIEFIETADDVVAVRVADRITSADVDALIGRLEQALARHATVHVYAQTQGVDAAALAGLGAHAARAMPMLARLRQFGRVAVVADQSWLRLLTRAESALLPFVSYRVFEPAQHAQALDWVRGDAAG